MTSAIREVHRHHSVVGDVVTVDLDIEDTGDTGDIEAVAERRPS